jgi:hypothetical protein
MPDRFLRQRAGGTDRTYAYLLVDHLRWLEFEGLSPTMVTFPDLQRYMAAVGAEYAGPFGRPWRPDRRPYSRSTLSTLAACLKGFYVFQGSQGEGIDLAQAFKQHRLPSLADRRRMFLGHAVTQLPANPLTPARIRLPARVPATGNRLAHDYNPPGSRCWQAWFADWTCGDGCLRPGPAKPSWPPGRPIPPPV